MRLSDGKCCEPLPVDPPPALLLLLSLLLWACASTLGSLLIVAYIQHDRKPP